MSLIPKIVSVVAALAFITSCGSEKSGRPYPKEKTFLLTNLKYGKTQRTISIFIFRQGAMKARRL